MQAYFGRTNAEYSIKCLQATCNLGLEKHWRLGASAKEWRREWESGRKASEGAYLPAPFLALFHSSQLSTFCNYPRLRLNSWTRNNRKPTNKYCRLGCFIWYIQKLQHLHTSHICHSYYNILWHRNEFSRLNLFFEKFMPMKRSKWSTDYQKGMIEFTQLSC